MNHSKINVRYAKALFSLGKDQGLLKNLYEDILRIYNLCMHSVDFMEFLGNPVIRTSRKKAILGEVLKPHISELALRFIFLVTEHQREVEIPGICRYFIDLVKEDQGILVATVTTAGELTGETLSLIRQELEQETGKTIELTGKINPAIIGGMVVRIDDMQYDGSISTQLKKIRSALTDA